MECVKIYKKHNTSSSSPTVLLSTYASFSGYTVPIHECMKVAEHMAYLFSPLPIFFLCFAYLCFFMFFLMFFLFFMHFHGFSCFFMLFLMFFIQIRVKVKSWCSKNKIGSFCRIELSLSKNDQPMS